MPKLEAKLFQKYLKLKEKLDIIIDVGKTYSNFAGLITQARAGTKVNSMNLIKTFLNSGAEIAIAIKATFSSNLEI